MEYRTKAINCVRDTVLPIQRQQFEECGHDLDAQYRKYGDTEFFLVKSSNRDIFMKWVIQNVCARKCFQVKLQTLRIVSAHDKACCMFWKICCLRKELMLRSSKLCWAVARSVDFVSSLTKVE